jgi:hypothetical protein
VPVSWALVWAGPRSWLRRVGAQCIVPLGNVVVPLQIFSHSQIFRPHTVTPRHHRFSRPNRHVVPVLQPHLRAHNRVLRLHHKGPPFAIPSERGHNPHTNRTLPLIRQRLRTGCPNQSIIPAPIFFRSNPACSGTHTDRRRVHPPHDYEPAHSLRDQPHTLHPVCRRAEQGREGSSARILGA